MPDAKNMLAKKHRPEKTARREEPPAAARSPGVGGASKPAVAGRKKGPALRQASKKGRHCLRGLGRVCLADGAA